MQIARNFRRPARMDGARLVQSGRRVIARSGLIVPQTLTY
jgi:hypothetical protein